MTSRIFEGSTLASDYARYRPSVPAVVTESVIKHIREATGPKLGLVVDVGCGSGQFTQSLAQYFDRALGFDVSEAQIEEAKKHNKFSHVEYSISPAEELPLESGCVDLLTVASAIHWFDMPTFTREVDRILKPGGCIAVIGTYRIRTIDHQNALIKARLIECREKYTRELNNYRVIDQQTYCTFYDTLEFPSYDMKRYSLEYVRTLTAPAYINFLQTISFSIKYHERNPNTTFFDEYRDSLHSILVSEGEENEASFQLTWFYDVLIASKPLTQS
ncbi:uncharacterized protein LOC129256253 [Lytechinus pictus]|uniref:uncharacterized protein LOC129256253 n=1 Tax=Lytechinus pictus TaxID=7653 RepID=UPI0030B9DE96